MPIEGVVRDLPQWLRPGDLLVANDSKVLPARLHGLHQRDHRSLEPAKRRLFTLLYDPNSAERSWAYMVKQDKALKHGDRVLFAPPSSSPSSSPASSPASNLASNLASNPSSSPSAQAQAGVSTDSAPYGADSAPYGADSAPDGTGGAPNGTGGAPDALPCLAATVSVTGKDKVLVFDQDDSTVLQFLEDHGEMPIPPYLNRAAVQADRHDYQTCYASAIGSVAAPTAGLHFTPELIKQIRAQGIGWASVTLHVGLGTFAPLRNATQTSLHPEWCRLDAAVGRQIVETQQRGGRVIAVGTTAARVLETAGLHGRDITNGFAGTTTLFIREGHRFNAINGLLTNFHLPESSLLHLVATFCGKEHAAELYSYAIAHRFRFYSYGDCMLLLP